MAAAFFVPCWKYTMLHHHSRWKHLILPACLLGVCASTVSAAHIPGTAQLAGWVYVDRNNDGVLNFANQPNPEFVIGDVPISVFSVLNNVETLVSTQMTDQFGRFFFDNLAPGTFALRQTQPVEFVDGLDTAGALASLNANPVPANASAGVAGNNAITGIVLTADISDDFNLFGERGLLPGFVSKRLLFASSPEPDVAVPEPATMALLLAYVAGCWLVRRRAG
jgi:hypothetical protein